MKSDIIVSLAILILLSPQSSSSANEGKKNYQFYYHSHTRLRFVGDKILLECPIKAPFYMWRFFERSSGFSRTLLDQDGKNITFKSADPDKSGIYECKSTSGFNNAVTNISLKIVDTSLQTTENFCSLEMVGSSYQGLCFVEPDPVPRSKFRPNERVVLDCAAASVDSANLRYLWSKKPHSRYRKAGLLPPPTLKNVSSIVIAAVSSADKGQYICEVLDNQQRRISKTFSINLFEKESSTDLQIINPAKESLLVRPGHFVKVRCEAKSKLSRIHQIKWGKRLLPGQTANEMVNWDSHNYRLFPANKIEENQISGFHVVSSIRFQGPPTSSSSSIYICVAMNSRGSTVHKIFQLSPAASGEDVNTDSSSSSSPSNSGRKQGHFFVLYIVIPAVLILLLVIVIICCCIRERHNRQLRSKPNKLSNNSLQLKKYNGTSNTGSNGGETVGGGYYYPISNPNVSPANVSSVAPVNTSNTYNSSCVSTSATPMMVPAGPNYLMAASPPPPPPLAGMPPAQQQDPSHQSVTSYNSYNYHHPPIQGQSSSGGHPTVSYCGSSINNV